MKRIVFLCGLLVANHTFAVGDALVATKTSEANLAPGFALGVEPHKIVGREDSQRIWEQVKYLTNFNLPVPRVEVITNRYTELGTGICYQQADGKWADSQARFAVTADGSVEATEMPHKVRISPELYSIAAVKMTLPDGRLMSSTFRGLYLFDSSKQQRLLVSDITNSVGTLISSNVLAYSNCFTTLKGDLVLKVTPAGLAQDVVIRESLAWIAFDEIAFDPKSTVLEAWTEFYETPAPDKQTNTLPARTVADGPADALSDESLKFGNVLMVPGRAYLSGTTNGGVRLNAPAATRDSVPVGKTWIEQDNRKFLIERLRWPEILPQFKRLETNTSGALDAASASTARRLQSVSSELIPPKLLASANENTNRAILLAQSSPRNSPALIFDYTTVTCSGGTCNGYRFEANETYYISTPVIVQNEAVLIGGSVIKLAPMDTSAGITFAGTVKWDTAPGRMVIITGRDDNSVGSTIAQSNGDPTSDFYGCPALAFAYGVPPADLRYIRASYLFVAVDLQNGSLNNACWHSQFFRCWGAFSCDNGRVSVYNLLFDHVDYPFQGGNPQISAHHVTAHSGSDLGFNWGGTASIGLTNSLIIGFPACTMDPSYCPATVNLTDDPPGLFEAGFLGAHYLPQGSAYRRPGTSPIDGRLRRDLRSKSTFAPVPLQSTISADTVLAPVRPRNDAAYPDVGFSYDAIDYVAQGVLVQSGTLLLTNGVVVGVDAGALSSGMRIAPGAKFISEGTPTSMNRLVELRSVQEQHGPAVTYFNALDQQFSESTPSDLRLRFTELPWRAGLGWQINRGGGVGVISLQDCQMFGGGAYANVGGNYEYTFALTNNLFQGSQFTISGGTGTHLHIWNNTFVGGAMTLYGPNFSWSVRDNLFQQMTLYPNGSFDNDYNAYYQTTPISTGGGNRILYSPVTYASGPLGNCYLAENSGNAPLRDAGSRSPVDAGLFHHTTRLSQQKEGSKSGLNVDIGFHYVAVESENFALHKYATQSSTVSGHPADLAIDGNTSGSSSSITTTSTENQPWWQLDLGFPEDMSTINIWNRTDCCGNLLRNFYVLISDDPFQSTALNSTLAQAGVSSYYVSGEAGASKSVAINRSGQFVRIQLTEQNALALAEVEVFAPFAALDAERDGLPDYLEDLDRDGNVDAGETDFKGPIVAFTTPADGFSIGTTRMNVHGTVSQLGSTLKRVTVNGIKAFLSGNTFDVLNVPLAPGANKIVAVAEDINGNSGSASMAILATGTLIDPVTLTATPSAGFEQLNVAFQATSSAPGTFLDVRYDFEGDGTYDATRTDLTTVSWLYNAGEYSPVATIRTSVAEFSSVGGWSPPGIPPSVTVRLPPQITPTSVGNPIDIKSTSDGHVYVLATGGSPIVGFITEYDATWGIVRTFGLDPTATGIDVDTAGKVYVAIGGTHEVRRLAPAGTSFQLDTAFNGTGKIGKQDGTAGSGPGEFNAPYDVAIAADGSAIYVSDTGNHRIQKFTVNGSYVLSIGSQGSSFGQFSSPKGVSCSKDGALFLADSGNNRLVQLLADGVYKVFGSAGTAAGQYQGPLNAACDIAQLYVADSGNNRVQKLERQSLNPVWAFGSELGLSQPASVAVADDPVEERLYIADTGHARVLTVRFPKVDPISVWNSAKQNLVTGNLESALAAFSETTVDLYRSLFAAVGNAKIAADMSAIPNLTLLSIDDDEARYFFTRPLNGQPFAFPVIFSKENGQWKIRRF